MNAIEKSKEKSKSIKRAGVEHCNLRENEKKKKDLTKDYELMIGNQIFVKNRQLMIFLRQV